MHIDRNSWRTVLKRMHGGKTQRCSSWKMRVMTRRHPRASLSVSTPTGTNKLSRSIWTFPSRTHSSWTKVVWSLHESMDAGENSSPPDNRNAEIIDISSIPASTLFRLSWNRGSDCAVNTRCSNRTLRRATKIPATEMDTSTIIYAIRVAFIMI